MKRKFKFHIYVAQDGIRWRCRRSGKIVFESGEAYKKAAGARKGVTALTDCMITGSFDLVDDTR